LQPEWTERWPQLAKAAVCPAIGDGAAANIGSGCDTPDRIALTIGTTGAMRMVVDPSIEQVPLGLWLYRVDGARGLLGGATTEGGSLFAWLSQTLRLPPAAELEAKLVQRPPTAHGLTVLPFIGGERAPGWNEAARGTFSGVSMHTDAVDFVQASLESIAYRFALIHGRIKAHLPVDSHQTIIASGGALLQSPAWMQIMADVLGQPVVALEESELTSRGVALLALEALGQIGKPSDLPPATGKIYEPDPDRHAVYQDALARQVDLYERLYG
jgi:gluconokinase